MIDVKLMCCPCCCCFLKELLYFCLMCVITELSRYSSFIASVQTVLQLSRSTWLSALKTRHWPFLIDLCRLTFHRATPLLILTHSNLVFLHYHIVHLVNYIEYSARRSWMVFGLSISLLFHCAKLKLARIFFTSNTKAVHSFNSAGKFLFYTKHYVLVLRLTS